MILIDCKESYIFYKGEIVGRINVTCDGCFGSIEITEEQYIKMIKEIRKLRKEERKSMW